MGWSISSKGSRRRRSNSWRVNIQANGLPNEDQRSPKAVMRVSNSVMQARLLGVSGWLVWIGRARPCQLIVSRGYVCR
jgi:hypothetical protein